MSFYRPLEDIATEHLEWAVSENPRITLGFPSFDLRTKGVGTGELLMFLARSGVGKTAWGCNVAVNNRHTPTVFFSLEMKAGFILQRLAAIAFNRPTWEIERNLVNHGEDYFFNEFLRLYRRLAIIDKPGMSLRDMSKALGEVTEAWGVRPRLVLIDFLELIKAPAMSAVEGLDMVTRKLKDFARDEDVATVVLHQLKKAENEKKQWGRVSRADARYGGDTSADYTLAAYRPGLDPENKDGHRPDEFYLQFLKTRTSGGLDTAGTPYFFDEETMRITRDRV